MTSFLDKFKFKRQSGAAAAGAGQDARIPYQVYETIHQPSVRRRKLVVAVVLTLLAVILIIFFVSRMNDQRSVGNGAASQVEQTPEAVGGSPTQAPAVTPLSEGTNDGIVQQPQ